MRIFEFDTPGIENILNVPKNLNQPAQSKVGATGNVGAQPSTSMTANNQTVINTVNGSVQPLSAGVKQHLTPGGDVRLPMGPTSLSTQLKVKTVGTDKDRTTTLVDPQHPNQPGQTYRYADLAKTLSDQENKK